MITKSNSKVLRGGETAFKICLFFYAAFGACNLTRKTWPISVMLYAMTALGLALLAYRALHGKSYIKMPLLACAALMWASYIVSALCNWRYITKDGLVYLGLWTLYFFLLYTHEEGETAERVYRDLQWFSALYMVWTTALALISFWMLAVGYDTSFVDAESGNYTVAAGIHDGRLWGAFLDPNLGSVMCGAVIAMCAYWFRRREKTWLRIVLAADALAMLFYIAMSDSRNGMLCLGVVCAVGAAFAWFGRENNRKPLGAAAGLILMGLALVCGALAPYGVQKGYNAVVAQVRENAPVTEAIPSATDVPGETAVPEETPVPAQTPGLPVIERDYTLDRTIADLSNRRFWVWGSAVEIAVSRPLTGVSFVGVLPYVREYMPETYIVNNGGYWDMNTFDSEIFNILAAQGFPGLLILVVWFVLAVILFFRGIGKILPGDTPEIALLTILSCMLVTSALNQGTMFYQTTPNTVLFWIAFGDLLFLLKKAANGRL